MQVVITIALGATVFAAASALATPELKPIPESIFGSYIKTEIVRDYSVWRTGDGLTKVNSTLSISKAPNSTADVEILAQGENGHSCVFRGKGVWTKGELVAQSVAHDQDGPLCFVRLMFSTRHRASFTSYPDDQCRQLCGVRATLDKSDLTKFNQLRK